MLRTTRNNELVEVDRNDLPLVTKLNHYIEYDEQENGELAGVNLHFGSRNFGVKVCKYWMKKATLPMSNKEMREATEDFKEKYAFLHHGDMLDFREALLEFQEKLKEKHITGYLHGENLCGYLCDMCFAQLYAQYNHKTVQGLITGILKKYGIGVSRIITSVHNFIDLQDHVIRKSAIRAYAGEEMLVPFNMRDGIAICEGKSNAAWLNSCAHGAGRKMSRSAAKRDLSLDEFKQTMKGIYSTTVCSGTLDESPMVYKDTEEIVRLIQDTCTIKAVLKPRINIKATNGGEEVI